jgi:hypothetical protein
VGLLAPPAELLGNYQDGASNKNTLVGIGMPRIGMGDSDNDGHRWR